MLLFITLLFLPLFLVFLLRTHGTRKYIRPLPGPRGLPLIGNLHQFDGSNPKSVWKLSQKYGPLMFLRLGSVPTLVVSSAKMAKDVLKTHDLVFCSRPVFLSQQTFSYQGLDISFAPYSDYWRELRKIAVVHLFSSNRVQQFRPIREDEVRRMIQKIDESVVASQQVNLSEQMTSLTRNIIFRVGFGKRYDDGGIERSRLHALFKENQALLVSFFVSDYFPSMGWVDKITGMKSRLDNTFKELDAFYQQLIEEHLDPKNPKKDQEDIIDVLLQLRNNHGSKIEFTSDHIKAVVKNIFLAGTETTAATVVWIMTYLMKNPRAMKKVQEEVRSLFRSRGSVDEDDLYKLSYFKAVIKETLRLNPVAPLLVPRETMEKCIIEGYEIPAKTLVFVNALAIGRDPEAWENPDEFYPERFIGSSIDFKGQYFEFITFGAGRRICPGLYMGIAIVELALANLLYKFDWEMPCGMKKEDLDFDFLPGITLHKKNPLLLMARYHK